jgi:phosphonate transport system ATP-binding protein
VDLDVQSGQITMLLGRSGSGKTTLLKLLAGVLKPQRGAIDAMAGVNGARSAWRLAYIPQTLGLVRNMTTLENTLAGALSTTNTFASLFKVFPRETLRQAKDVLADLGLGTKTNAKIHELSGGERQRVAIARALMLQPDLILADEFVSQLDPVTSEEILDNMRSIAAKGVGLLITTHETDAVAQYADDVYVMQRGRITFRGKALDMTEPQMVSLLR